MYNINTSGNIKGVSRDLKLEVHLNYIQKCSSYASPFQGSKIIKFYLGK
jgi:hypothetical protein